VETGAGQTRAAPFLQSPFGQDDIPPDDPTKDPIAVLYNGVAVTRVRGLFGNVSRVSLSGTAWLQ